MNDSDENSEDESPHLPRWRAVGDVSDARRLQWRAVKSAERLIYDYYEQGDREGCRKAVTALTQAIRCYASVVELDELEARIERLERVYASENGAPIP